MWPSRLEKALSKLNPEDQAKVLEEIRREKIRLDNKQYTPQEQDIINKAESLAINASIVIDDIIERNLSN